MFNFIKELENLADEYKYLAEHKLKTRNFNNKKGIELLDEINVILDRVYKLFYEFKKQDAAKIETEIKELKGKLSAYNKDVIFAHRLMNIYRRLKTMLSSHYSLRVE